MKVRLYGSMAREERRGLVELQSARAALQEKRKKKKGVERGRGGEPRGGWHTVGSFMVVLLQADVASLSACVRACGEGVNVIVLARHPSALTLGS
jgi:hypothetical protein